MSKFQKAEKICLKDRENVSSKTFPPMPYGTWGLCLFGVFFATGLPVRHFQLGLPFYLGQSLENINCPLKRDRHSPSIYTYTPTLLFLCPTGRKNETFHSRPKSDGLAEIKHQFSKGFWIQREMPTELQNTLGLTDS